MHPMTPMTALGAALYHDVHLVEDTQPIEALLDSLFAGESGLKQFCVPLAPRRERPSALRREKLLERVSRGELFSFMVGTDAKVADADVLTLGVGLSPTTAAAQEGSAGYRYRLDLAAGAAVVARRGAEALVESLLAFASAVPPRAGVVFPAESASFAHALASGARGGLSEQQDRRVREVFYAVYELGDRIRGPEWGTFLGAHHVAKLGDLERVRAESGCAVMRSLPHGGAYLQVTERIDDPQVEDRLAALASALAPVR